MNSNIGIRAGHIFIFQCSVANEWIYSKNRLKSFGILEIEIHSLFDVLRTIVKNWCSSDRAKICIVAIILLSYTYSCLAVYGNKKT